jgi:hypothetical protein
MTFVAPEIYSDEELKIFFRYILQGYCYKQSTAKAGYDQRRIEWTLHTDYDVRCHMLDLSMAAGAFIREGIMDPPPDRWDGLYDEYIKDDE